MAFSSMGVGWGWGLPYTAGKVDYVCGIIFIYYFPIFVQLHWPCLCLFCTTEVIIKTGSHKDMLVFSTRVFMALEHGKNTDTQI